MNLQGPATTAQVSFIEGLLRDRLVVLGMASLTDAAQALNLQTMSKEDASTIITRLKGMPKDPDNALPDVVAQSTRYGKGNRPGLCATCGHAVEADTGYYYLLASGKWAVHHKVGDCSAEPAPAPVEVSEGLYLFNDQFILVYKTKNQRLAGKVLVGRRYQYQQGAVQRAAMGTRVTAEQAALFGHTTKHCVACGRHLEDGRSTDVGYGPVCAAKYGWPWGERK